MKKTLKTVMAALTAVTMLTGTIGTTVFAADTGTAAAVSAEESIPYDGVFSQGATYHFISNGETLIVDGDGTFTREEFVAVAEKLNPRMVALCDNVSVSEEWIREALVMNAPYIVICHHKARALDDIKAFRQRRVQELEACGKYERPDVIVDLMYDIQDLSYYFNVDFYEWCDYWDGIVRTGKDVEEYLIKKKISERTARKIAGCYMFGLRKRIYNLEHLDDWKYGCTNVARPDGTEVNELAKNWWFSAARDIAEIEDAIVEGDDEALRNTELGKFHEENSLDLIQSKYMSLLHRSGGIENMIRSGTTPNPNYTKFTEEDAQKLKDEWDAQREAEAALEPVKIQSAEKIKGDVNADGAFTVSDVVTLQKALTTSTATLDMDINGDGKVNVFDLVTVKQMLADTLGGNVKSM